MIRSVRGRAAFAELRARGERVQCGPLRVVFLPSGSVSSGSVSQRDVGLAFAIGRRFGTAVERNRSRRRVRAAFVVAQQSVPLSGTFLLIPSRRTLSVDFASLVSDLEGCLGQLRQRSPLADRAAEN